jgi:hypothetical protein
MNNMKYLVDKYPDGYEGWEKEYKISQESEVTSSMAEMELGNAVLV